MYDSQKAPLYVQFPHALTACVMDTLHGSLCGRGLANTEDGAARVLHPGERMDVCACCRASAQADGATLPKVTGYQ